MIGTEKAAEMTMASTGPRMEPCMARAVPRPKAMVRMVPWKNESPMPESGPMREVFTALMVSGSKFSGSRAYSSSIEEARPSTKALVCGVQL